MEPRISSESTPRLEPVSDGAASRHTDVPPLKDGLQPLSFEDLDAVTDAESAPIMCRAREYTKLECMNAKDVNATVLWFNICVGIGIVFTIIAIILAQTVFNLSIELPQIPGTTPVGRISTWSPVQKNGTWYEILEAVVMIAFFVYAFLLLVGYIVALCLSKSGVSNEQIWTALMLAFLVLYLNPYDPILRIVSAVDRGDGTPENPGFDAVRARSKQWHIADVSFACMRIATFSTQSLLYAWLMATSYGILDRRLRWRDCCIYFPRILVVMSYVGYKLFFTIFCDIYFSELPFMSAVGCIRLYVANKAKPALGIASTVVLTIFELVIVVLMALEFRRTGILHNECDYMVYRTKVVGYRFFLHQHFVFYSAYALIYLLILVGFPFGVNQLALWTGQSAYFRGDAPTIIPNPALNSVFDLQYTPVGLHLVILAYATIEAYAKLPVETPIDNGWGGKRKGLIGAYASSNSSSFRRSEPSAEPVSYRQNEEVGSVVGNPNTFTMGTHIKQFNLAWYVYHYGTEKQEKLDPDVASNGLKVVHCVNNARTDTCAVVLEAEDRICVAFKGTSSMTNWKSDVNMTTKALRDVLPTTIIVDEFGIGSEEADKQRKDTLSSRRFRRAKIHAGFASAYLSVASELLTEVRRLLATKKRPLLLCGHSLGGALATIMSVDIVLQPWWGEARSDQSLMVSSFGSPRVGNWRFAELYSELKVVHWRLVAGGDIIARLPKVGYSHVGHKVAITQTGGLFIDPDALETRLWNRPAASIQHHRKVTYLLSLRAWCKKQHAEVEETSFGFWDFSISKSDFRKYKDAFDKKDGVKLMASATTPTMLDSQERNELNKARLEVWAKNIDMLGTRSNDTPLNAVQLWSRLTKPVLADIRADDQMDLNAQTTLSAALFAVTPLEEDDEDFSDFLFND